MTKTIDTVFQAKLLELSKMVVLKIDDLFDKLKVDVNISGNKYVGCCHVHGGDNKSSFNLYSDLEIKSEFTLISFIDLISK